MNNSDLLLRLKKYLSPISIEEVPEGGEILFLKKDVDILIDHLKREFQFLILLDITAEDLLGKKNISIDQTKRFEVVYNLLNLSDHFRLRIRVPIDEKEEIKSLTNVFNNSEWYEQEIWDMFGIQFEGLDQQRILNHQNFEGFPLRKDFVPSDEDNDFSPMEYFNEEESVKVIERGMRSVVNIGPVHPITKGAVRTVFELDGNEVKRNFFEIGYNHKCIEKSFEEYSWYQGTLVAEQISSQTPFFSSFAYCYAVESLFDINIPDRAKAIRMVFSEFSRILDHLNCISELSLSSGNETVMFKCLDLKERIYELFERATGNRVRPSINIIGGLVFDLPLGWVSDSFNQLKYLSDNLNLINKILTRSHTWMTRSNICEINVDQSLEFGFSGPCLRASGINYDMRKVSPYYFYNDVEFEIPLGINGQCYDRFLVRLEEIRQSIKIIYQVLDNLPVGGIVSDHELSKVIEKKDDNLEGKFPVDKLYRSIESSNGELGFYLISDGGLHPWRVHLRSPSFSHLQGLSKVSIGSYLDDVLVGYSSLNVIPEELNR